MTLKRRIALIIAGAVVFLLAGPAVVLLAQGYRFDWDAAGLTRTGTLVVKSEPRAEGTLSGLADFSTPLTDRFIMPGEYQITLSKPGYRSYTKRVNVSAGLVTFVPDQNSKIYLLSDNAESETINDAVSGIFAWKDSVFFVDKTKNAVFRFVTGASAAEFSASSTLDLSDAKFIDARISDGTPEFILQSQNRQLYVSPEKTYVLPNLRGLRFGSETETFLGLDPKNQLLELTARGPAILKPSVLGFDARDDQIYYVSATATSTALYLAGRSETKLILDHLPTAASAQVIVSPSDQIFLRLDSDLYAVKDKLEKIGSQVAFAYWDINGDFLFYGNDHETWMFEAEQARLLNRSTQKIISPVYHHMLGYEFFGQGSQVIAREADFSGQPNAYTLISGAAPIAALTADNDGKYLIYLEGSILKQLPIR